MNDFLIIHSLANPKIGKSSKKQSDKALLSRQGKV